MDTHNNKTIEVPMGITKEDVDNRKQIILDFYRKWKQENPSQRKYNVSLKDFVNIRNVSITETSFRASKTYLSTLAVLQLDAILATARKLKLSTPKQTTRTRNLLIK